MWDSLVALFFSCFAFPAFLILFLAFLKPIMAVVSILIGSKEGISEFGNFCEDKTTPIWHTHYYDHDLKRWVPR